MGTASGQFQKTAENAPTGQGKYCTYFEIYGRYFDASEPADKQYFVTAYRLYLGGDNIKDYNLLRNHAYTVNATLRGRNEVDMRVESVLNPANCYMVSEPSHEYTFNATIRGNGALTPAPITGTGIYRMIVPERLSPDGAFLLWETGNAGDVIEPGSVKLSDDKRYISFRTSATIGGNAVIAAALKNGQIIWSWHIWSTKYDPETSYDTYVTRTITQSGYTSIPSREVRMMKVNLGATSLTSTPGDLNCYGLYYQWGRKDPFIGRAFGDNGYVANTTNVAGYEWQLRYQSGVYDQTIANTIAYPTSFFRAASTNLGDWITTTQTTGLPNLWGNPMGGSQNPNSGQGSKSIYDPCPSGWRVPRADTWTMFTTTGMQVTNASQINAAGGWNNGWYFYCTATGSGPTAFYPAAGSRSLSNGTIGNTTYGAYWSSSPMSYLGAGVGFGDSWVGTLSPALDANRYMDCRAFGNLVRCAREE